MKRVGMRAASGESTTLYVISIDGTSYVKIGISNDAERRLRNLQTANPQDLRLEYAFTGSPVLVRNWETRIHRQLTADGRHIRGEWFWIMPPELEDVLIGLGLTTRRT